MICDFCEKKAVYKQKSTILCADCFGYFTEKLLNNWHKWVKNGKIGQEPPIWIYNHDNKIQE